MLKLYVENLKTLDGGRMDGRKFEIPKSERQQKLKHRFGKLGHWVGGWIDGWMNGWMVKPG